MPKAVKKSVESSSEDSDDESESLDAEVDDMDDVERGSATETDDSNDESDNSDVESDDEVAESDGADPDDSVIMKGTAALSPPSSAQNAAAKGNTSWNGMFQEAKNFVASHGTMLVPFNHRLFPWLKDQAALYRRGLAGEKKLLTAGQKQRLKILGMDDFLENPVHKLRDEHLELCWLGERSRDKETGQATLFDWEFIRRNASKALSAEMAKKETFGKRKNTKLPSLVGRGTQTRIAFDELREEVRAALDSGVELNLTAGRTVVAAEPPAESSDEESSEDEAVNARVYDSDDSSSVNLDEMAKNAAVDDNGSSSGSDSDDNDSVHEMKIVSDVPDDKWSLRPIEEEVAWLGEESMLATKNRTFDWTFIRKHASSELKRLIKDKEIFTKAKHQKMYGLIPRMQNKKVKRNFDSKREEIRKKLASGFRRKQMKKVLTASANETDDDMNDGLGTAGLNLWQDTSMPTLELNEAEEDLAWLLEEQAHYGKGIGGVDWEYVLAHASPTLKQVIEAKKVREAMSNREKFGLLLRSTPGIKEAFDMKRGDIRKKLADGYRRDSKVASTPSKKATPSMKTPTSRSKKSLNDFESEVAHLVEESMFHSDSGRSDWVFIEEHASPELLEHMKSREIFTKFKNKKLPKLVRLHDEVVAKAFQQRRLEIRESLIDGVRREETKSVLPKKPGKRWQNIFKESSGPEGGKKRSAAEADLDDHDSDERQKLSDMQEELCWLMQESQFANGNIKTDWSFVEKHASKRLKLSMQEKKDRNVKYRTVYAFFNIQANPRLKRAYDEKCSEIREFLESGHRRKGTEKFLPKPGEVARTPLSAGKAGAGGRRKKKRPSKAKVEAEIITDGFLDSSQASPAKGYEEGRKVSVRHSADYYPSGGNKWGEATLHTFIDIKKSDGGYSRQYKVRLKNGEFGWLGTDHVKSQDDPNEAIAGQSQGEKVEGAAGASSVSADANKASGPAVGPYGLYESVFVSVFPSESPKAALPALSKEVVPEPPKKKTPREELQDLIGELRFQRENYRQEMRRQNDRFEAHASLMERLEQKAMAIVMKEDAKRSEEAADAEPEKVVESANKSDDEESDVEMEKVGDKAKMSEGTEGIETKKVDGAAKENEMAGAADDDGTEKACVKANSGEGGEDAETGAVGENINDGEDMEVDQGRIEL